MSYWSATCNKCHTAIVADKKVACPACKTLLPDDAWVYDPRTSDELEQHMLDTVYYCPVCRSTHSKGGEDLSGQVCFPQEGKYHCEGILRKITKEELFGH
jgi:RNA polymerase subunit RPABC4/transcription elongation factor Spt4